MKKFSKILCLVLVIAMAISIGLCFAPEKIASARTIVTVDKDGDNGVMHFTVSDAGILTWTSVSGATGYYITTWFDGGLQLNNKEVSTNSFELINNFDSYKRESGYYEIQVTAKGVAGKYDYFDYRYVSPYDKLEAPSNLRWDGNTAEWDAVTNATSYKVQLFNANTNAQISQTVNSTSYDFSSYYPTDGYFFTVQAIADSYRNSNTNESVRYGTYSRAIATVDKDGTYSRLHFNLSSTGVLTWTEVDGATSYNVTAFLSEQLELDATVTTKSYDLIDNFDSKKKEYGYYDIQVTAIGVSGQSDYFTYRYVSPYDKLEAPSNLRWNGNTAEWDAVTNATSYKVQLFNANTNAQISQTVNSTSYDFSSYYPTDGYFFTVQAIADSYRNSNTNESVEKVTYYTVTFDSKGGSSVESQIIANGATATNPTAPTKTGYYLCGWYEDEGCTTLFDFSTPITADKTLYARWDTDYCYIYYDTKGGNELSFGSVPYGEAATHYLPGVTNVTKEGYIFAGWYLNNEPFDDTKPVTTSITLVAKWNIAITSANATITAPVVYEKADFHPVSSDPTAYNVVFVEWKNYKTNVVFTENSIFDDAGGSYLVKIQFIANEGYEFVDDDKIFTVNNGVGNNQWTTSKNVFGFMFGCEKSKIHSANATITAPVAGETPENISLVSSDASKYTVSIDKWYLYNSSKGDNWWQYDASEKLTNTDTFIEGTQYAVIIKFQATTNYQFADDAVFTINGNEANEYQTSAWREYIFTATSAPIATYKVSFNSNGGTGSMADISGLSGTYNLPNNEFTAPSNKCFKGWSLTSDGEVITSLEMTENKTVYAIWDDIKYTISFNSGDGTGTMASQQVVINTNYSLPVHGFTAPDGKQFKCWQVGGENKNVGSTITITENITLTAIWEDIPTVTYSITYQANGGSGDDVVVNDIAGTYVLASNTFTAPAHKQFKAWLVNGEEKQAGTSITVSNALVITAVWDDIKYSITFDNNGGAGSMTSVEKSYGESYTLPTCTFTAPAGKEFKTWLVNEMEYIVGDSITITKDVAIKALWADIQYQISFDNNGGTGSMSVVGANGEYTLPENTMTAPEGKEFKCWLVNGTEYKVGATINVTENTVIKAVWADKTTEPDLQPEEKTDDNPTIAEDDNDGLSGGAVAGIVIGSLAAVSIGAYFGIGLTLYKKGKLAGNIFKKIYKWIK